ncbi:hypothetical protein C1H46_000737 [Malus baccata]|uniref:Uncharacterized protein n=1 Tax=Malus baccata TaxID=106549 RepID=A0A540NT30_MALBA|nr:hypothetical protein C1H46_000737 [Malus baccata]
MGHPQTRWAAIQLVKEPKGMLSLEGEQVQSAPLPFSPQIAPGAIVAARSQWDGFD